MGVFSFLTKRTKEEKLIDFLKKYAIPKIAYGKGENLDQEFMKEQLMKFGFSELQAELNIKKIFEEIIGVIHENSRFKS
jgi:hypothetical protein